MNDKTTPLPAWLILLTVFVTGASILVIELIGTRVLAPFFGSGIYTWSALIAITLAALALGYAIGGRLADQSPQPRLLYLLCLVAGLWTLLTPWVATILLPKIVFVVEVRAGVLISSLLLFSPNLFLLGMASPFAIRLFSRDHEASGRTSGLVFSISTLGSLLAALMTGFYLVPNFGVLSILTFCGLTLMLISVFGFIIIRRFSMAGMSLALAIISATAYLTPMQGSTATIELLDSSPSFYGHVQVVNKHGFKVLLVDGIGQNYAQEDEQSILSYISLMSALPVLRRDDGIDSANTLVIGLGAGHLPMLLARDGFKVETVEIDPVIGAMATRHFGFDAGVGELHYMDGRLFLSKIKDSYDYIFFDAFNADQIPGHLLSKEALETTRSRLQEGGLLAINVATIADGEDVASLQETLNAVFPFVRAFNEDPQANLPNIIFLASTSPIDMETGKSGLTVRQRVVLDQYLATEVPDLPGGIVLSDDYNPISHLHMQAELRWREDMHSFLGKDYYGWAFY